MTSEAWTIRYAPKSAKEVQGQDKALSSLKVFLSNYKRQKKRAALLYGAPGSGKTCSVYAIAAELDLEVLEINASDFRNKSKIDEKLEPATKQMSLFAKGKVILVDEVDGLSGTKDRGGLQEVLKIIEDSAWPIVMTITDPYDQKFSKLRKKSEMIEFHTLNYLSVNNVLKKTN